MTEDGVVAARRGVMLHSPHHLDYRYDLGPKLRDERPRRRVRAPSVVARLVVLVRTRRAVQLSRSTT
ncbi:MAG: hypothetical protein ACM33B_04450 [Pseudomonadota bacterium]